MGTRSAIAIFQPKTNNFKAVYCHWDGYWESVGATLSEHYTTTKKVKELISLGSISSLGQIASPPKGSVHTFDNPLSGVTVAYGRDRQELDCSTEEYSSLDEIIECIDCEYLYVFCPISEIWGGQHIKTGEVRRLSPLKKDESPKELIYDNLLSLVN